MLRFSLYGILPGFLLDLILGDPHGWPHIVRGMGHLISFLEKHLWPLKNKFLGGLLLVVLTLFISTAVPLAVLVIAFRISPWLYLAVEIFFVWQLLAVKTWRRKPVPYTTLLCRRICPLRAGLSRWSSAAIRRLWMKPERHAPPLRPWLKIQPTA